MFLTGLLTKDFLFLSSPTLPLFCCSDALSAALSALYAKLIVVLGLALPVTNILHYKGAASFYQGFYLYLYTASVCFISFVYITYLKSRPFLKILNSDDCKWTRTDRQGN